MDTIAHLLRNNEQYAASFAESDLAAVPRLKAAVVTCMDARIDPVRVLGLEPGDAHVIRNAGAVITDDVIRSLSISQHQLGTETVLVVAHTTCGLLSFRDEEFAAQLEAETGRRPAWSPGAFSDLEASVREGVERIRDDPFLPHTGSVRGFVYEVENGRMREVA